MEAIFDSKTLFATMVAHKASDMFLKPDSIPTMKVSGTIQPLGNQKVTVEIMKKVFEEITSPEQRKIFEHKNELDTAYEVFGVGRFRANIFKQRGNVGMVFRYVQSNIPALDKLKMPAAQLQKLILSPRGLVLVTGTAGSGKSSTIASMLSYVNQTVPKHIITIEDPIEYLFIEDKAVFDQREVGIDTDSFATALKYCLRQAPDIIMIGEMRDKTTMDAAIGAAETGHLVISTLHSLNAYQTVERILNFYPPHEHTFLRQQMSLLLMGCISQRLLPRLDGQGVVPAVELMLTTPTVKELLSEGKTRELYKAIYDGSKYYGTQTFNQSLRSLYQEGLISLESALAAADNPDELKLEIRGIVKGSQQSGGDFNFKI
ncbi:MAG: PilT/PilU family type 4a pilus ATPase [Candidatus Brocadiia bacterium]